MRGVPTLGDKSGRAGDGSRVPGPIRQIGCKHLAFVGCDQHVVIRRPLQEQRHLALDLNQAAVGAARTAGIFEHPFLHDLGAETRGGTPQRFRIDLIRIMGTDDEQPSPPSLDDEILSQRVCQHGSRRRGVDHVGPAVFLAQAIVDRPGVEEHQAARPPGVGRLEQRIGRQIGDEKRDAAIGELRDDRNRIVTCLDPRLFQREMLVEKFPRRVVVFQCEAHARNAVIVGRKVNQRNGCPLLGTAEIADLDAKRLRHRKRRYQRPDQSADDDGAKQRRAP
jgi:hypothetical protein